MTRARTADHLDPRVRAAARAVALAGLSSAFGHVSARDGTNGAVITPPIPLGHLGDEPMLTLDLEADELPDGAPREAWMHVLILRGRPDVGAVCRAQPPSVAAWAALDRPLPVLNGHAALLGPVATHRDSRLVRDAAAAAELVTTLGGGDAVILRGNGAVTVGADLASAVARMWVLERSAELALRASGAGEPRELPADEQEWWRERSGELLHRIYDYLSLTEKKEAP
jgi:HCOMODA/2-hydroxy-3-carboxy-muconic semialdehyde decarboxylase